MALSKRRKVEKKEKRLGVKQCPLVITNAEKARTHWMATFRQQKKDNKEGKKRGGRVGI